MGACAFGGRQRGASLLHSGRSISAAVQHGIIGGMAPSPRPWFLYLLECRDGSYYAGISTDVAARFAAHQAGKGARYTRARPPLQILAVREYPDRSAASRAEWQLKQQPRERKLAWLQAPDL